MRAESAVLRMLCKKLLFFDILNMVFALSTLGFSIAFLVIFSHWLPRVIFSIIGGVSIVFFGEGLIEYLKMKRQIEELEEQLK